jgi:Arc/MetJ-type ribon-helix-helix transcriptional regulator
MSESTKVTISIVVEGEMKDWLEAKAKTEDNSVSKVVRAILKKAQEEEQKKEAVYG